MIERQSRPSPRPTRTSSAAILAACLAALVLGAAVSTASRAQSGPVQDLSRFPRATLEIHGHSGTHRFNVWIADNPARQTQGLMFVRDLPADEGMLFTNCCTGIWMKNTYIPLDILFIGAHQRIVKIAVRAQPFDLATISAAPPISDVVELKGGVAALLGLKVGDRVAWKTAEAKAPAKS